MGLALSSPHLCPSKCPSVTSSHSSLRFSMGFNQTYGWQRRPFFLAIPVATHSNWYPAKKYKFRRFLKLLAADKPFVVKKKTFASLKTTLHLSFQWPQPSHQLMLNDELSVHDLNSFTSWMILFLRTRFRGMQHCSMMPGKVVREQMGYQVKSGCTKNVQRHSMG